MEILAQKKSALSLEKAEQFTRELATSHYENFVVGSLLIPKEKRQHIYNVYAFARTADDLADETSGSAESLKALKAFEADLEACFEGKPNGAVFVALRHTVEAFDLPIEPFKRLLVAFRQDQRQNRYETFEQLLGYCQNSANPVGELFLLLFGYRDEELLPYSDAVCTGLQLANFWQDVARDARKNRLYLPLEDLQKFGVEETEIFQKHFSRKFRSLMEFEVERTQSLFDEGKKLFDFLHKDILLDVRLFVAGGEAMLKAIQKIDYNVLTKRPIITKKDQARLFAREWWRAKRKFLWR